MTEHAFEITLTSVRSQHAGSATTCSTCKTSITFLLTLLTSSPDCSRTPQQRVVCHSVGWQWSDMQADDETNPLHKPLRCPQEKKNNAL